MIKCNCCGSEKYTVVESYLNKYKALECQHCHIVYVHPRPSKNNLKCHYDNEYYRAWMETQKPQRIRMWRKRMKKINRLKPSGRLLDIGCAEGLFLRIAKESGWEVEGTEISEYAIKEASKHTGHKIYYGEVWEANFDSASFDIVTIWHVLEHVLNPSKTLQEARRLLKPNGQCIVAVPNLNNRIMQLAYRIAKGRPADLFSPEDKELHLYHFSEKTLKSILYSTGFKKIEVKPDYGIIDFKKKLINLFSVIPFYFAGIHCYNSLEATASV